MRWLAVGIAALTAGVYAAVTVADWAGAGAGIVLLVRGLVTVAGLCAVLYALLVE
jgi:putative effector of murein hydrolase